MIDLLYNISLHVPDLLILLGCAVLSGLAGVLIARLAHWLWWARVAGDIIDNPFGGDTSLGPDRIARAVDSGV